MDTATLPLGNRMRRPDVDNGALGLYTSPGLPPVLQTHVWHKTCAFNDPSVQDC